MNNRNFIFTIIRHILVYNCDRISFFSPKIYVLDLTSIWETQRMGKILYRYSIYVCSNKYRRIHCLKT